MANFPSSCTECGFLFDTTVDLDQSEIDAHLTSHTAFHGVPERLAAEAEAAKAAFLADEERRIAAANAADTTPVRAPLADFVPTPVEETL
jgi:hypothetical protein